MALRLATSIIYTFCSSIMFNDCSKLLHMSKLLHPFLKNLSSHFRQELDGSSFFENVESYRNKNVFGFRLY